MDMMQCLDLEKNRNSILQAVFSLEEILSKRHE
jgi:hypothetical protein